MSDFSVPTVSLYRNLNRYVISMHCSVSSSSLMGSLLPYWDFSNTSCFFILSSPATVLSQLYFMEIIMLMMDIMMDVSTFTCTSICWFAVYSALSHSPCSCGVRVLDLERQGKRERQKEGEREKQPRAHLHWPTFHPLLFFVHYIFISFLLYQQLRNCDVMTKASMTKG
jgi:hypothetical protein